MRKLLFTLVAFMLGIAANAATVYFQNTANWSSVYAYAWTGAGSGWPGEKVTTTIQATNGQTYYKYVTDKEEIIFNQNGSPQTKNLKVADGAVFSAANVNSIDPLGTITESNGTYTFKEAGAVEVTYNYLYFPVYTFNYTKVNVYTWNPTINTPSAWPGQTLSKQTINGTEFWVFPIDSREFPSTFGGLQLNDGTNSHQPQLENLSVKPNDIIDIYNGVIANDPTTWKPSSTEPTAKPWLGWYVKLDGDFNDWYGGDGKNEVQLTAGTNGIAEYNNVKIYSDNGQQFYISAWTGSDNVYYGTGGQVEANGQPIQLSTDVPECKMTIKGNNAGCTFNFKFDANTGELTITLASGTLDGSDTPVTPDVPQNWYLYTQANWSKGNAMAIQNDGKANEKGEYQYQITGVALTKGDSFKIFPDEENQGGNGFGYGNNAESQNNTGVFSKADETIPAVDNGANFTTSVAYTNATLTFFYNPNGNSWLQLQGTIVADEPTPEPVLYFIGNIDNNSNWSYPGELMDNEGDGIYTLKNVKIASPDGNGYFVIADGEFSNWDAASGNLYGGSSDNEWLEATQGNEATSENVTKTGKSWKIANGIYDVTFEMTEDGNTLTVEYVGEYEGGEVIAQDDIFVRGDMTGEDWAVNTDYKFTKQDNGTYTLNLTSLNGEFKIASSDWSTVNLGGDGNNQDIKYVDAVIGNNTLYKGSTVNLKANALTNVKLTLTYTIGENSGTLNISADQGEVETNWYFVGEALGWDLDESHLLSPVEGQENVFAGEFELTGKSNFQVATTDWKEKYTGEGDAITSDTLTATLIPAGYDGNGTYDLTGKYTVTWNATTHEVTFAPVGTEEPETATWAVVYANESHEMTGEGDDLSATFILVGPQTCYFTKTEGQKVTKYGPAETTHITSAELLAQPYTIEENENVFWITDLVVAGGDEMTFNLNTTDLTVTFVKTPETPSYDGAEAYLCTSTTGAPEFSTQYPMTGENGMYSIEQSLVAGTNFNVWVRNDLTAPASAKRRAITADQYTAYGPATNTTVEFVDGVATIDLDYVKGNTYWTVDEDLDLAISINPTTLKGEAVNNTETEPEVPEGKIGMLQADDATIIIDLGTEGVVAGMTRNVEIPVRLIATEEVEYNGFQFNVEMPEGFTLTGVEINDELGGSANFRAQSQPGVYRVIGYDCDGLSTNSAIEYLVNLTVSKTYTTLPTAGTYNNTMTITDGQVIFSDLYDDDILGVAGSTSNIKEVVNNEIIPATAINITAADLMLPSWNKRDNYLDDKGFVQYVTKGQSIELTFDIAPANASYQTIEWTSSNTSIVIAPTTGAGKVIIPTAAMTVNGDPQEVTITATIKNGDAADATTVTATYSFDVKKIIEGDANDNGYITVSDVVDIADYILSIKETDAVASPANVFDYPNADIAGEAGITDADLTATINIVLGGSPVPTSMRRKARTLTNDMLVVDDFKVNGVEPFAIGVNLQNNYKYSSLQALVTIPEGMELVDITKGARAAAHELRYNTRFDGKVIVLLYSMDNAAIADGEGELFNLVVRANEECGDIRISQIKGADANANSYGLGFAGGENQSATTGVDGIDAAEQGVRYFTVDGVEIVNPQPGQIVIKMVGGKAVKEIVK